MLVLFFALPCVVPQCIDEWMGVNAICPTCRCDIIPGLHGDSEPGGSGSPSGNGLDGETTAATTADIELVGDSHGGTPATQLLPSRNVGYSTLNMSRPVLASAVDGDTESRIASGSSSSSDSGDEGSSSRNSAGALIVDSAN